MKIELTGSYLYHEKDCNDSKHYYLRAMYDVEDDRSKRQVIFPKILLPIHVDRVPIIRSDTGYRFVSSHISDSIVDIGFGDTRIKRDDITNSYMYEIKKEEKPQ